MNRKFVENHFYSTFKVKQKYLSTMQWRPNLANMFHDPRTIAKIRQTPQISNSRLSPWLSDIQEEEYPWDTLVASMSSLSGNDNWTMAESWWMVHFRWSMHSSRVLLIEDERIFRRLGRSNTTPGILTAGFIGHNGVVMLVMAITMFHSRRVQRAQ